MTTRKRKWRQPSRLTKTRIAEMMERATVDAYGDSEQITGWLTMIEENLALRKRTGKPPVSAGVVVPGCALTKRDRCTRAHYGTGNRDWSSASPKPQ
jgi:hypothetical protein